MPPLYEYKSEKSSMKVLIYLTGIMFLAMAVWTPLEGDEPLWLVILLRSILVFFGILIFPVTPMVSLRAFDDVTEVRYGPTKLIRFVLDNKKITKVESVVYNPMTEFGGWGIKGGIGRWKGWTAFTADGTTRALSIETTEKNYLLSCPDPDEAAVILKNIYSLK